jgi:prepilin-type N-terminal cleavage/methylation domain-containing protein
VFRSLKVPARDRGFTLIEVVVAIGILMIVVAALLPQLVVGIRANGVARTVSQAKGVAQGQLDRMRNLPYHVSPAAGDYRDVLDFYYRNLTPAGTATCPSTGPEIVPQTSWTGYVAAGAARCRYEPAAGPFYRSVEVVPATAGSGGFTVVVDTQFLSGTTPPAAVTPAAGYNTQSTGSDTPAASQIGITVTVVYTDRGRVHPVTTYSQLSDQPATTVRVKSEVDVTTIDISSETAANGPITYSAGLLKLAGSLTYASTVGGTMNATTAGLATGEQASGASTSVAAPPSTAASTVSGSPGGLSAGCNLACWGATQIDKGAVSSDQGLPNAGSVSSPMQALLTNPGMNGISFGNSSTNNYRNGLDLDPPLVTFDSNASASASGLGSGCTVGSGGASAYVAGSGYLTTTSDLDLTSPTTVEACAVAKASTISLFPTSFAPRGIVIIELRRAIARCRVAGAGHTATATSDYRAEVSYYDGSGYQSLTSIRPSLSSDPFDAINLATTSVGGGKQLGDYISSWSALLPTEVTSTQQTGLAEVQLPGVVTIASQPVRPGLNLLDPSNPLSPLVDPNSVVSLTVGAVSCSALDAR